MIIICYASTIAGSVCARATIDEVVLVSEEKIKEVIRLIAIENKLVVEGAGGISLAAALETPKEKIGKTACVLSGGSIDADKLVEILARSNSLS